MAGAPLGAHSIVLAMPCLGWDVFREDKNVVRALLISGKMARQYIVVRIAPLPSYMTFFGLYGMYSSISTDTVIDPSTCV